MCVDEDEREQGTHTVVETCGSFVVDALSPSVEWSID